MKHISLYLFVILVVVCIDFIQIQALECGIDKEPNQRELRQMAENCMQKNTDEREKPSSEDSESDESPEGTTTDSYKHMKRNKRNDNDTNHEMTGSTMNNNMENNSTTESDGDNCVVHCVFQQMSMLDSSGFPEHNRVSQALLKNANGRELRDFIQDTTDECFQLMDQGERHNPCQYSVTLVNCLADRGKVNCADWPVGNLSFLSKN